MTPLLSSKNYDTISAAIYESIFIIINIIIFLILLLLYIKLLIIY